jgi:hypothetical protein
MASATRILKLVNLAGDGLLALSAYLQGKGMEAYLVDPLFWGGLVALIVANLLKFKFEQRPADQLRSLHASEAKNEELEGDLAGS